MTNWLPIINVRKSMSAKREGEVYLICKILDRTLQVLVLNKVQYIPKIGINLIS